MSVTHLAGTQLAAEQIRREFDDLIRGQIILAQLIDPAILGTNRLKEAMVPKFRDALAVRELALLELQGEPEPDAVEMTERVESSLDGITRRVLELVDEAAVLHDETQHSRLELRKRRRGRGRRRGITHAPPGSGY
jgi:hypothetical protein